MYQIYPNLLFTEIKSRCSGPVAQECHAKRLALDWVVLALDQEAFQLPFGNQTWLGNPRTKWRFEWENHL